MNADAIIMKGGFWITESVGWPVVLAADDVSAFPDAPGFFNQAQTNGLSGRAGAFEEVHDYVKQRDLPHVWTSVIGATTVEHGPTITFISPSQIFDDHEDSLSYAE